MKNLSPTIYAMALVCIITLLLSLTGCGPAYGPYPTGTTPFQQWQIDQARSENFSRALDSFKNSTRSRTRWTNGQHTW